MAFTALQAAPGNCGRENWGEVGQEGSCEGEVLCQCVGVCCVSGISALDSREGGEGPLREGGCCVWAQAEARTTSQSNIAVEGDRHNI